MLIFLGFVYTLFNLILAIRAPFEVDEARQQDVRRRSNYRYDDPRGAAPFVFKLRKTNFDLFFPGRKIGHWMLKERS